MAAPCYVEEGYWAAGYTVADVCTPPVAQLLVVGGVGAAARMAAARAAFARRDVEWNEQLARIIDKAFQDEAESGRSAPQQGVARARPRPTKRVKRRVAKAVFERAKLEQIGLRISQAARLVEVYAAALQRHRDSEWRRQEEDAITLLLLA